MRGVWLVFVITNGPCFKETFELNANSVDPDQMPHSAASDIGLHCLLMSQLWGARLNGLFEKATRSKTQIQKS